MWNKKAKLLHFSCGRSNLLSIIKELSLISDNLRSEQMVKDAMTDFNARKHVTLVMSKPNRLLSLIEDI